MSALRRLIEDPPEDAAGREVARLVRAEADAAPEAVDPAGWLGVERRLRGRARRWPWWSLLVPAAAAAGGVGWMAARGGSDEAPAVREPAEPARGVRAAGSARREQESTAPPGEAPAPAEAAAPAAAPAVIDTPAALEPAAAPDPAAARETATPRRAVPRRAHEAPGPQAGPAAPAPAAAGAVVPAPAADADADLDALGRQAEAARRAGDGEGAARAYRRLARASGLRAENALLELGAVRLTLQGDPAGALAAWREHRERFPGGQLAAEVDLSILDALERLGRREEAIAEARRFAGRHPRSERLGEVHALAGALLGEGGDCPAALDHLDRAAAALPRGARADDVARRRAACLRALGRKE